MSNPLIMNLGQQLDRLKEVVSKGWAWPSPGIGFSLHVFDVAQQKTPFLIGELTVPDAGRLYEAPALAAVGYTLSLRGSVHDETTLVAWADGFDRLSSRKVFPVDRETFVYRPLELLGISLGALHCPNVVNGGGKIPKTAVENSPVVTIL